MDGREIRFHTLKKKKEQSFVHFEKVYRVSFLVYILDVNIIRTIY